jgi:hypothetical protein
MSLALFYLLKYFLPKLNLDNFFYIISYQAGTSHVKWKFKNIQIPVNLTKDIKVIKARMIQIKFDSTCLILENVKLGIFFQIKEKILTCVLK